VKILIRATNWVGDAIMALPALRAVRAKIPERIGYNRDGRGFLLTKRVPVPKAGEIPPHEKFYYLELLRRAGWIETLPEDEFISLNVPETNRRHAAERLLTAGARPHALRVAVGAGASYGSAKCWPADRFAKSLNMLLNHTDADVIMFGTPAEAEVSEAIANGLTKRPVNLTGKTAIADLPALLSQCHLFLGNDSGAMHVAAAVGLPAVAVFGPTDPNGTAPVTPRRSIVQEKPYCSPCFLRRCPTDHRCMKAVTPDMVEANMRMWLAEVRPG
jgi:lipopolysaccharide heptosyltransferase II